MNDDDLFPRLLEAMPPPEQPRCNAGDWDALEATLGIAFPSDYKRFIDIYGTGVISSFVYVTNYFDLAGTPPDKHIEIVHSPFVEFFPNGFPFPLYPEPPLENYTLTSFLLALQPSAKDNVLAEMPFHPAWFEQGLGFASL